MASRIHACPPTYLAFLFLPTLHGCGGDSRGGGNESGTGGKTGIRDGGSGTGTTGNDASATGNDASSTATGGSTGICADSCLKDCVSDNDCDVAGGELCCDYQSDGKACVPAAECPRFCSDDQQCQVTTGEACVQVVLETEAKTCAPASEALTACTADSDCTSGQKCCTIYDRPTCLSVDECPKSCSMGTDCNSSVGEVCCASVANLDSTLSVPGLCLHPNLFECPRLCATSSDCNTQEGQICCEGVCSTTCTRSCTTSNDCPNQICCKSAAARSPFRNVTPPGYPVYSASGGTAGSDGGATGGSGGASGSGGTGGSQGAPSCVGLPATCGPLGNESCCVTLPVTGGTFYRDFDAVTYTDMGNPATISSFLLDKYEVTVGRFRKFIAAWNGGWRPAAGAGKHTHLNGGNGLAAVGGGYETGWDTAWASNIPTTPAEWDATLACHATYQTWTSSPAGNENRPINCTTGYEAIAFCIWDGGFIPSEAEWNYAAAGGNEQRVYPWSVPPTSSVIDDSYAVFCGTSCNSNQNVGSKSPKGDGKFGQADLAGNQWEWTLDVWHRTVANPCVDCVQLSPTTQSPESTCTIPCKAARGENFQGNATQLYSSYRNVAYVAPNYNEFDITPRCARAP